MRKNQLCAKRNDNVNLLPAMKVNASLAVAWPYEITTKEVDQGSELMWVAVAYPSPLARSSRRRVKDAKGAVALVRKTPSLQHVYAAILERIDASTECDNSLPPGKEEVRL